MVREIITTLTPENKLREKCAPFEWGSNVHQNVVQDLVDTAKAHSNCVGLAAPQIGYNVSCFVANITLNNITTLKVFINPFITYHGDKKLSSEECMSVLSKQGKPKSYRVFRYSKVKVNYVNNEGTLCSDTYTGILAVIIQHEYDHLQGKLIQRKGD
jgi:peptide deformylase